MKIFKGKDINQKSLIVTLILTAIAFVLTVPFFFFNLMGIPFGILTGGLYQALFFYLFKVSERKMSLTVSFQITRTVLMGILTVVFAILYKDGFVVFNPFAFLGAYLVILIIYVIMARKERNDG